MDFQPTSKPPFATWHCYCDDSFRKLASHGGQVSLHQWKWIYTASWILCRQVCFLFFLLPGTIMEAMTFARYTDTSEFGRTLNEPRNKVGNGGDMAK